MTIGSIAPHDHPTQSATDYRRGWDSPIPVALTPLIGRKAELETAAAMLRRRTTRLLTLTGPGGIGKTRLATEIVLEAQRDFADGIAWVSLAPVYEADAVVGAIASSLGITGVAVGERLSRALRESQLLLILDNFEQVLDAAPHIAKLLGDCPQLQVVVTSRARLRIRGERVLPVPPLSHDHAPTSAPLSHTESPLLPPRTLHSEAVTLFIERAQAVVPSIDIGEPNTAVVAEICRQLDGLPLAIELAAARVSHLPLNTLLARMDRRLPLLVAGDRDMPPRLQTMRSAIAWSYNLLTPHEQAVLRCLSVFEDGFQFDAAEDVLRAAIAPSHSSSASGDARPETPTLDVLSALVENSLVRHAPSSNDAPRYTILETIREFAFEHLVAAGEEVSVRQAHALYFLRLAEQESLAHFLPDGERRLDALEAERANMRAALSWWGRTSQSALQLALAAALGSFWYARIHVREGHEWLARVLDQDTAVPTPERARALVWLSLIEFLRGEMEECARDSAEGLRLCRELGESWSIRSESPGAIRAPERDVLQPLTETFANYALGVATFHLGSAADADAYFEAGRRVSASIPDARLATLMAGNCTRSLGIVAGERGDLDEAERLYDTVLRLSQSVGFRPGIRRALGDLAYLSLQRADYPTAFARFKEVLAQEDVAQSPLALYDDLRGAAIAATFIERSARAVHCLAAAEALGERLGLDTSIPSERAAWESAVATARRAAGMPAFTTAWATGRTLLPAQAIDQLLAIPIASAQQAASATLSERELEVLRLLVAGQTDRAIGEALFISHRTVEFHVSRILAKLGANKRSGAVAAALAAGLVEPPPSSPQRV